MIVCNKCGAENPDDNIYCAKCGNKLTQEDSAQSEEVTNQTDNTDNINTKSRYSNIINIITAHKRLYIIIPIIIILIAVSSFLIYNHTQNLKYAKIHKDYEINYIQTTIDILTEVDLAEQMCDTISTTWKTAIDNEADFNNAIQDRLDRWQSDGIIDKRRDAQLKIEDEMRKLKNPPSDFKETYNLLIDLYSDYSQIYDQATTPQGSLVNYNQDVDLKESEFQKIYDKIKVIEPDIAKN